MPGGWGRTTRGHRRRAQTVAFLEASHAGEGGSLVDPQLPGRLSTFPVQGDPELVLLVLPQRPCHPQAQVPARSSGWTTQWDPRAQQGLWGLIAAPAAGRGEEGVLRQGGRGAQEARREEPVPAHPQPAGTPTHRPSGDRIPAPPPQRPGLGPLRPARARQLHAAEAASSARPVPAPPALSTGND